LTARFEAWLRPVVTMLSVRLTRLIRFEVAKRKSIEQASTPLSYSATFKDHLTNPRNVGELTNPTVVAEETNPVCGDRLRLSLIIKNNQIEVARYLAYGCPPTLVSGSVLTEMIIGGTASDAANLTSAQLIEAVGGLPSRKHHAASLAIEALRACLSSI
jgi:nitrogen fixation NifU-like protein